MFGDSISQYIAYGGGLMIWGSLQPTTEIQWDNGRAPSRALAAAIIDLSRSCLAAFAAATVQFPQRSSLRSLDTSRPAYSVTAELVRICSVRPLACRIAMSVENPTSEPSNRMAGTAASATHRRRLTACTTIAMGTSVHTTSAYCGLVDMANASASTAKAMRGIRGQLRAPPAASHRPIPNCVAATRSSWTMPKNGVISSRYRAVSCASNRQRVGSTHQASSRLAVAAGRLRASDEATGDHPNALGTA